MEEDWSRIAGTSRPDAPSSSSNHALVFWENFARSSDFRAPSASARIRIQQLPAESLTDDVCVSQGADFTSSPFFFFWRHWQYYSSRHSPSSLLLTVQNRQRLCDTRESFFTSVSEAARHHTVRKVKNEAGTGKRLQRPLKNIAIKRLEIIQKRTEKKVSLEGLFLSFICKHRNVQYASMQNVGWEQVCRKTLQTSNDKRTIRLTWLCPGPRAAFQQLSFNSTSSLARWQLLFYLWFFW